MTSSPELYEYRCKYCRQWFESKTRLKKLRYCSMGCAVNPESIADRKRKESICQVHGCHNSTESSNYDDRCGNHRYPTNTSRLSCPPTPVDTKLCFWCGLYPQWSSSPDPTEYNADRSLFCGKLCMSYAERNGPFIFQIPTRHPQYDEVQQQFIASWRHPSRVPEIQHIYAIVCASRVAERYIAYRDKIDAKILDMKDRPRSRFGGLGNERRRWHGTLRKCNLGDNGITTLCNSIECSLCRIIQNSFDLNCSGRKTRWGRGHYTSSTSSKSDDYSNSPASINKALLLNSVVVGRGKKLLQKAPHLRAPPSAKYDSVLGEVGGVLNYDECVVYNDSAIKPSYLVIYEDPSL